jgi:hypothetical protein
MICSGSANVLSRVGSFADLVGDTPRVDHIAIGTGYHVVVDQDGQRICE